MASLSVPVRTSHVEKVLTSLLQRELTLQDIKLLLQGLTQEEFTLLFERSLDWEWTRIQHQKLTRALLTRELSARDLWDLYERQHDDAPMTSFLGQAHLGPDLRVMLLRTQYLQDGCNPSLALRHGHATLEELDLLGELHGAWGRGDTPGYAYVGMQALDLSPEAQEIFRGLLRDHRDHRPGGRSQVREYLQAALLL